jgi:hypothetical protein
VVVLERHLHGFVERDSDWTLDLSFRELRQQDANHQKRGRAVPEACSS